MVFVVPCGSSASDDWLNWTSFSDVRRMCVINDTVFAATSGGLLAIVDPTQPGRQFINTDGLGTTDITDIIVAADGQKWVTGLGRLIKFNYDNPVQYLFRDVDDHLIRLYCVVDNGDLMWVGTNVGLVLFSKKLFGGQILDSYSLFGDLNPSPTVTGIQLVGDSIWIATSDGLAVANKSQLAPLKAPAAWTVFNMGKYPELGSSAVTGVIAHQSEIYVTTARGVFRLERSTDTSFLSVNIGSDISYAAMRVDNDSLFYYGNTGSGGVLGYIEGTTAHALPRNGLPSSSYPIMGVNTGSFRWAAVAAGGIYQNSTGSFARYAHTGPPGNNVSDIAVSAAGLVTAGFTSQPAAQYDGTSWRTRSFWVREGTTRFVVDSAGRAWGGTRGNGLWLITDSLLKNYDENNSTLRGNSVPPAGPNFVFITGLATDAGYVYAVSFLAVNGYPIAIGDLSNLDDPSAWDSLGVAEGINDINVTSLDCYAGYLAIGAETKGVFKYYMGPEPADRSDDAIFHYTRDTGYLVSDNVSVVKFAPDGSLWVGTSLGLSRWDAGLEFFVDVDLPRGVGPEITDIEFDGRGSVWIGSRTGLARLNMIAGSTDVYSAETSGLLSDNIRALTFDRFTGRLFVATDAGISVRPSEIGLPTDRVEDVIAFPNPFVIRSDTDGLKFNFDGLATLRIFASSGELVLETELTTEGWDGRNQQGTLVASGVYLFVLNDQDGHIGRGKFLLVRE
jgi:ligand-binding sensor domain-containing protein